jgi:histidinol-phosphate/aromatic aminotransferase/cobyric acid decarboxylase-like protein
MITEIPKPTIAEAIELLSDRDEFKVIVSFIRDERERFFSDLRQALDSNEVMKITGSISTLTELIDLMSTDER